MEVYIKNIFKVLFTSSCDIISDIVYTTANVIIFSIDQSAARINETSHLAKLSIQNLCKDSKIAFIINNNQLIIPKQYYFDIRTVNHIGAGGHQNFRHGIAFVDNVNNFLIRENQVYTPIQYVVDYQKMFGSKTQFRLIGRSDLNNYTFEACLQFGELHINKNVSNIHLSPEKKIYKNTDNELDSEQSASEILNITNEDTSSGRVNEIQSLIPSLWFFVTNETNIILQAAQTQTFLLLIPAMLSTIIGVFLENKKGNGSTTFCNVIIPNNIRFQERNKKIAFKWWYITFTIFIKDNFIDKYYTSEYSVYGSSYRQLSIDFIAARQIIINFLTKIETNCYLIGAAPILFISLKLVSNLIYTIISPIVQRTFCNSPVSNRDVILFITKDLRFSLLCVCIYVYVIVLWQSKMRQIIQIYIKNFTKVILFLENSMVILLKKENK